MTVDEIIDGILDREKEGRPPYLAPGDAGGRTSWGISERSHPDAWRPGPPSRELAREIYERVYVAPFDAVDRGDIAGAIRVALIDDAVMSGVEATIKRFQGVLGVERDGVIGPLTVAAAAAVRQADLLTAYTVERAIRITRLVQRRPSDLVNLTGWITRILGFLP